MSKEQPSPADPPVDRRRFFRQLLLRGIEGAERKAKAVEARLTQAVTGAAAASLPAVTPKPLAKPGNTVPRQPPQVAPPTRDDEDPPSPGPYPAA